MTDFPYTNTWMQEWLCPQGSRDSLLLDTVMTTFSFFYLYAILTTNQGFLSLFLCFLSLNQVDGSVYVSEIFIQLHNRISIVAEDRQLTFA